MVGIKPLYRYILVIGSTSYLNGIFTLNFVVILYIVVKIRSDVGYVISLAGKKFLGK